MNTRNTILVFLVATAFCLSAAVTRAGEIHDTAMMGDLKKVEALIKANPDLVNAKDNHGWTPLHNAAMNGYRDVVELLLANKSDVDAKDEGGMTPLHFAAGSGDKDVAELLLAKKADVNSMGAGDLTPLAIALKGRRMVDILHPGFFSLAKDDPKGLLDGEVWRRWRVRRDALRQRDEMIAILRKHGGKE